MSNLSNFSVCEQTLNEILYDYLNVDIKPEFCLLFFTETIDVEKVQFIHISCMKCCGIKRNPKFSKTSTDRQWFKKVNTFVIPSNDIIETEVKKARWFETTDWKGKPLKGYYDFAQLSSREKYIVANIIFKEQHKDIPEFFLNCTTGKCH
jgi:hypothetical protein